MTKRSVIGAVPVMVTDLPQRSRPANFVAGIGVSSARKRDFLSLGVGAAALAVVSLVTFIVFRLQSLPIAGEGSIGQHGAIASAFVAFAAFAAGRWVLPRSYGQRRTLHVLDIAVVAFAYAVIALLTWMLVANILERAFIDAVVFGLPGVIVAGAMAATTAFVVFYSATQMRPTSVATVLGVFFVEGIAASMLAASDPHWWNDDFSALGATDDPSALAFNLTLIVTGLMITTLARYAPFSIRTIHGHGIARVRLSLILVGISLAMVGVVPADTFYWVHTGFAGATVVIFVILLFLLPRWLPAMPTAFFVLGWLIICVVALLFVLFAVGAYTLTAVELVAGALVLVWINMFVRRTVAIQRDVGDESAARSCNPPDGAMGGAS